MELPVDLPKLAKILAEWVEPAPGFVIYLFGSRVRGDNRSDSDVDVVIPIPQVPSEADATWWMENNQDNFKSINSKLPGSLSILENADAIADYVRGAREVHRDGKIRCVWTEPKP